MQQVAPLFEDFAGYTALDCRRKAHSQNVVYAEVFFDPQAHTTRGIPFSAVIEGFHRAQREAEQSFGLRSQLIMCFLRDLTAESAAEPLRSRCRTVSGSWGLRWTRTRRATHPVGWRGKTGVSTSIPWRSTPTKLAEPSLMPLGCASVPQ